MTKKDRLAGSSEEELPEYERIRRRNIEDRRKAMIENGTFQEIHTLNHQIINNTRAEVKQASDVKSVKSKEFGVKAKKVNIRRGTKDKVGTSKRKSIKNKGTSSLKQLKKKAQNKKNLDEDEDYEPPRNLRSGKVNYEEYSESDESSEEDETRRFKRRRGLPRRAAVRAARKKSYAEIYIPSTDEFIFCDYPSCQDDFFEGCALDEHEVVFVDAEVANSFLKVDNSKVSRAGEGVFNMFECTIPMGVIFGPYTGTIVTVDEYKSQPESGYAWELLDPDKKKVIAYVDPGWGGVKPDKEKDIFAYINSANCKADQNLISVQYRSQVVYRVCQPIPYGKELLTYYGDSYSKHLGIKPELYHQGKKKYACTQCDMSFGSNMGLWYHVKSKHQNVTYPCKSCPYTATSSSHLDRHHKSVHMGQIIFRRKATCKYCKKTFFQSSDLERHIRKIHSQ